MRMKVTCNKYTALAITRYIRISRMSGKSMRRIDVIGPDISPRQRWNSSLTNLAPFGLSDCFDEGDALYIVVPDKSLRPKAQRIKSTTYKVGRSLPPKSFIEVMPGLAISSPELLFLEMAGCLNKPELIMLGNELCGTFSRNPRDPLNNDVAMHLKALTTKAKMQSYCRAVKWSKNAALALEALELVADNVWAPSESIVATLLNMPLAEFGYELGPCVLNEQVFTPESLAHVTKARSRTPDILLGGTHVGINYDGSDHLDLNSIVDAALSLKHEPGNSTMNVELDAIVRKVRAKAVDDIKRNRELTAAGYIVFPVVKEDLYEEGGLDRVVLQIIETLEHYEGIDMSEHRRALENKYLKAKRQEFVWSLLPGKHRTLVSNREDALPHLYGPMKVHEDVVDF